jgi:mannosyltransferase
VAGGVLFLPWLPVFLTQLRHTGTPWGTGPRPIVVVTTITQFGGSNYLAARFATVVLVAMALVALWGHAVPDVALADTAAGRWHVRLVFAIGGATLLVGVGEAMLSNTAYQVRYGAVVFPFVALVVGSVLLEPKVRVVVLSVLVAFSLVAAQHWITMDRTESASVASVINAQAHAGDVVVFCPDQVGPATTRLIDASKHLRQLTFPSAGSPRFVNWTDYAKRNHAASTEKFARSLLAQAPTATIWYVWSPGYLTYDVKCEKLLTDLGTGRQAARTLVPIHGSIEHISLVEYAPAP